MCAPYNRNNRAGWHNASYTELCNNDIMCAIVSVHSSCHISLSQASLLGGAIRVSVRKHVRIGLRLRVVI